jgi:hypothetical protein
MPNAENYAHFARECRELAAAEPDEAELSALLALAAQWDRLAAYNAERENEKR